MVSYKIDLLAERLDGNANATGGDSPVRDQLRQSPEGSLSRSGHVEPRLNPGTIP